MSGALLSDRVRIAADGTATVLAGKVELGQGILTALTQIAAEELEIAPGRVRVEAASTARGADEGVTAGSLSVQIAGEALARTCAEVRAAFLGAAARRLGVAQDALSVEDGAIAGPGNAATSYWELAEEVDLDREATGEAPLRPAGSRRVVGRDLPRVDIPGRVFATRPYIHDHAPPGMLHARMVRPELAHAELISLDETAARAVPGFVAVARDGDHLGVLAETEAAAELCRERLARGAEWRRRAELPEAAALDDWIAGAPSETTVIAGGDGDDDADAGAPSREGRRLTREYSRPFLSHASIAPSCAVAQWRDGGVKVLTHAQGVGILRAELARVLRLDPASVEVEHAEGAGCYGHNGADDAALDAALLARAAEGRPVRLRWSRRDEFADAPFGAAMLVRLEAGLSPEGRIASWLHDVRSNGHVARPGLGPEPSLRAASEIAEGWARRASANPPPERGGGADRNAVPIYDLPAIRVESHRLLEMPLRTSSLRGLGAYANVFAIESFMDELAEAAGADPLAFRLAHLTDPRARAVLEAAADRAGWAGRDCGDGRGKGLALARYKGTGAWCAAVAEVEVDETVRARRLWLAADVGCAVNPDGVRNQIEGGAVQATSWTLREAVRFDRERVTSEDWDSYPILRFSEVPQVEVEILDRPDEPALGAGEAAQGPVAGALANAVAAALGVRVRRLPVDRDALIAAMELA